MWEKTRVVFAIPELRQKIWLTLLFLAIYRIGWQIMLPFVDTTKMTGLFGGDSQLGDVLDRVATFSASNLTQATIFGLGIMPYISASIIFQLLGTVWEPLERLQKEGESGRKKINEYTRYATVGICLIQSWFWVSLLASPGWGVVREQYMVDGHLMFGWKITAVLTMTAGTTFLMWLGEQIDEYGIGERHSAYSLWLVSWPVCHRRGSNCSSRCLKTGLSSAIAAASSEWKRSWFLRFCSSPSSPEWSSSLRGSDAFPPRAPSTCVGVEYTADRDSICPFE